MTILLWVAGILVLCGMVGLFGSALFTKDPNDYDVNDFSEPR